MDVSVRKPEKKLSQSGSFSAQWHRMDAMYSIFWYSSELFAPFLGCQVLVGVLSFNIIWGWKAFTSLALIVQSLDCERLCFLSSVSQT